MMRTEFDSSVRRYTLNLNGESLAAWCGLIDARSALEKQRDRAAGKLTGPVAVFFTGHAQRPLDARRFAAELARRSRSGLVLLPVGATVSLSVQGREALLYWGHV